MLDNDGRTGPLGFDTTDPSRVISYPWLTGDAELMLQRLVGERPERMSHGSRRHALRDRTDRFGEIDVERISAHVKADRTAWFVKLRRRK